MPHRKNKDSHIVKSTPRGAPASPGDGPLAGQARPAPRPLKIVLKGDSQGSIEAIRAALANFEQRGFPVEVIHADLGPVNKSDLLMAGSGDRLVVGFQVGTQPKLDRLCEQQGVEVRLYNVIYALMQDLQAIMEAMAPAPAPTEKVLGQARVIALFKTGRKGIIIGCEVQEGKLIAGKPFRIIGAMGPIHSGRIESMQIDNRPVKEAAAGHQVGIKIGGFQQARVGDWVECFQPAAAPRQSQWSPKGRVVSRLEPA